MFILLRKQYLKNMSHRLFSRISLMTCYSVASAHMIPYIVLAARGLNDSNSTVWESLGQAAYGVRSVPVERHNTQRTPT